MGEDKGQPFRQEGEWDIGTQPQVNDAPMRQALADNQLAKIPVIGNENPLLSTGDGQNLGISQPVGKVLHDALDIVPLTF
jgi:hypothetical protein